MCLEDTCAQTASLSTRLWSADVKHEALVLSGEVPRGVGMLHRNPQLEKQKTYRFPSYLGFFALGKYQKKHLQQI